MYRLILFGLACVFLLSGVASAQDGDELQCDVTVTQAAIEQALALLQGGHGQDVDTAYAAIIKARDVLAAVQGACLGLDFNGDQDMVTDPVYLPAGIYRATAQTTADNWFSVLIIALDGACYHDTASYDATLFSTAQDGDQAVLTSEGCTASFEIKYVDIDAPYAVTFEKLR